MSIISIGEVLVDRDVFDAFFCCPIDLCHGACCVEGELGAPIDRAEDQYLQSVVEPLRDMIPEKSLRHIRRHGCTELYQGSLYTRTLEGRECVFVTYRDGAALCAVEIAWREGRLERNKPLSCSLFPIRVRKRFGLDYLVYERHSMCREARKRGEEERVRLIDHVGPALVARYGQDWYRSLKAFADSST